MSSWNRSRAAALVAVVLLLAGCGGSTEEGRPPARRTGPGDVVVQVMVAGGFLPAGAVLAAVPRVTVLGDGTVITQAPVPAIYPGPAMPPLQAAKVDATTVDRLIRRAGELGLLTEALAFGRPPVADAPDTIVTITSRGRTYRHAAYALGIEAGRGAAGLGEREQANRTALQTFVTETEQLPPGTTEWKPGAIAAYVLGDYQPEPNLTQPQIDWPLAEVPATTGGTYPCTLVDGDDAPVLLRTLARANARTPWSIGGSLWSMAFRPVVPGQPGCPTR